MPHCRIGEIFGHVGVVSEISLKPEDVDDNVEHDHLSYRNEEKRINL